MDAHFNGGVACTTRGMRVVLRIVTPLVGIREGLDHEMSQPRLNLEVGTP
jgi:hypothetical protein